METSFVNLFDWDAHYYLTKSQERWNGLAHYLATINIQIADIETEQSKQLKKDLEAIPDSFNATDKLSFIQFRQHEYQRLNSIFVENFRYSFIVLVWLVIEDELKKVCIEVQNRKGIVPHKWKGSGVFDQCKEILKIADVTDKNVTCWADIRDLQKIRDCIVHTSGFVNESRDKKYLKELTKKHSNLQIDDYYERLEITNEFCELAVQNAVKFFIDVFYGVGLKTQKESNTK